MTDYAGILKPDCIYHIYNRANGSEKLFILPENYNFFSGKIQTAHSSLLQLLFVIV